MLINSLRFYERILLGLFDPDEEVQACAASCLSYFAFVMKYPQVNLPDSIAALCQQLPTGSIS